MVNCGKIFHTWSKWDDIATSLQPRPVDMNLHWKVPIAPSEHRKPRSSNPLVLMVVSSPCHFFGLRCFDFNVPLHVGHETTI